MAKSRSESYKEWLNKPGNREKKNAQKRAWNTANREHVKAYKLIHKTPEVKASEYAAHIEWKKRNPDRLKVYHKRSFEKIKSNPQAIVRKKIRQIIYCALKAKKQTSEPIMQLTELSKEQFKNHIEAQFKSGMTWDNYGSYWQIDHIKPLVLFDLLIPEEYKKANHYSNLQPLLTVENLKKGKQYNKEAA